MLMVISQHCAQLIKLSLGQGFQEVLSVFCVIEESARLAAAAQLVQRLHVVGPQTVDDLFGTH